MGQIRFGIRSNATKINFQSFGLDYYKYYTYVAQYLSEKRIVKNKQLTCPPCPSNVYTAYGHTQYVVNVILKDLASEHYRCVFLYNINDQQFYCWNYRIFHCSWQSQESSYLFKTNLVFMVPIHVMLWLKEKKK